MPLTDLGRQRAMDRLIGVTSTALDATNCHVGVGDSAVAFAAAQTDLQAATNKLRKLVNSAPSRTGNVLTYVAAFGSAEANFVWAEFAGFDAATAGTMAFRNVAALGTKASGSTWTLTTSQTWASS